MCERTDCTHLRVKTPKFVSTIHPDKYKDLLASTMKHYQDDMERSIFTRTALFPKPDPTSRTVKVKGGPLHGKTYKVGPSRAIRIPAPISIAAFSSAEEDLLEQHMCWVELPFLHTERTDGLLLAPWRDRKVCCSKADEAFGESRTGPTKR